MRAYLLCAKNAFLSGIAYRFNTFFSTVAMLISVYVKIAIWRALYSGTAGAMATDYGAIGLADMITYVIISTLLDIVVRSRVILEIDQKIKSGEIAFDINRPFSFYGYMFSLSLGRNAFRFVFEFTFIALFIIPFYHVTFPAVSSFLLFLLSMLLGMQIHFLLAFTMGLLGFWYLRIWHMDRILSITIGFFSGSFVPLWFFPPAIAQVGRFLPFQYIHFVPMSIYMEKIPRGEMWFALLIQLCWIGLLSLLCRWVFSRGVKKLVIQGG